MTTQLASFMYPGHCDAEWFWHSGECPWQASQAVLTSDMWYHPVAIEQQVCQGSTASC